MVRGHARASNLLIVLPSMRSCLYESISAQGVAPPKLHMTSEQIKATPHTDLSQTQWLKEIAWLLALLNEKKPPEPPKPYVPLKGR